MASARPPRLSRSRAVSALWSARAAVSAKPAASMPIGSTIDTHVTAFVHEAAVAEPGDRQDLAHAVEERAPIGLGVKAHDIERAHRAQQFGRSRQCVQQRRRHERRVQEEADAVAHAEPAQFLGQREQMVVMHPDQIVLAQQPGQRLRRTGGSPRDSPRSPRAGTPPGRGGNAAAATARHWRS